MDWFPLADRVGAEVRGVDLATVDGAALDTLKELVWDKGVAVLRDQSLTPEDHIALANRWGGIDINNYFPLEGEHPEIAIVGKTPEQTTNIGGGWHTDHSYDQVPAMGSILVARTLPPRGGDTLFIHMGEAYDSLDAATKEETLEQAVDARKLVGQAQGIIMERYNVDADAAFDALMRFSQDNNLKLRELAEHIVSQRSFPER